MVTQCSLYSYAYACVFYVCRFALRVYVYVCLCMCNNDIILCKQAEKTDLQHT